MVTAMRRKYFGISLLMCVVAGVTAHAAATSTSAPEVQANFDNGSLRPLSASGNAPAITTEHVRAGRYALKSYLSRTGSSVSYRTEVTTNNANALYFSDTWYGLSVFLPSNYVTSPVWEIVFQWHGVAGDPNMILNPPISMHTEDGVWRLSTIGNSANPPDRNYESLEKFPLGSYSSDLGRWTDWVFRIRWDYRKVGSGNDGLLQVWKNGVQVVNQSPIQLGFDDGTGPYFKMGLYKGWRSGQVDTVSSRLIYHDEFRQMGADGSYNAVAPAGSKLLSKEPRPPARVVVQ
jgi:Polysaccharide lyase